MTKPYPSEEPADLAEQVRDGGGFHYVAREILVAVADLERVARTLEELGARQVETDAELSRYVARYRLPGEEPSVPEVVERLRRIDDGPEPRVGPNHVLAGSVLDVEGQPNYHGGPGGPPIPAGKVPPGGSSSAAPVRVAILDTGVAVPALQYPLLYQRFIMAGFRPDPVYTQGTDIALMGGHGTMVAGILARHAPNASLLSFDVLTPDGLGTEVGVAAGIFAAVAAGATVLNLSLGGYVMPGQPPVALDAALAALPSGVSVVAAAGNYGSNKPFYPACHDRVVGVAALDTTFAIAKAAGFSNFGPWVDAASAGVRIHSTYVTGTWSHKGWTQTFTGYAGWSGTSFAAPHVAAMIADNVKSGTAREAETAVLAGGPRDPDYGVRVIPAGVVIS